MKKENKKKNIFLFFLKMVVLFIIFDVIMNNITPVIITSILGGKFGRQVIAEACVAFLSIIILLLFKNSYVFNEKKEGFFKSLKVGGFMLGLGILLLIVNLTSLKKLPSILDFISLIIFCFLIGIFEEFLCRGWIQNEFIERFAKNRKEVILSIILSSLIFGGMHISNIWIGGQDVITTIAQIIQATGLGVLLGSVYYRTKNIWASVFLHGFWDFAVFIGQINVIKECTTIDTSYKYLIYMLISSIILTTIYFLISLYILRKSKTNKIIEEYTEEEIKVAESNNKRLLCFIVILYFSMSYIPVQEAEEICYEYGKIGINYNEITYPDYKEYSIKEENLNLEISITSDNKLLIKDLNKNTEKILEDKYIDQLLVIKNSKTYVILLRGLNDYQNDTIIYYSNFINLNNLDMNDQDDYLSLIINSFITIDKAPTSLKLGYVKSVENDVKYPFVESSSGKFVYYEEDLYILDKEDNIEKNQDNNESGKLPENKVEDIPLPNEIEIPKDEEENPKNQNNINENNTEEDS